MREGDIIVGLFYSNENNLIYDQIKYSEDFPEDRIEEIRTLSFKFLGPLFLSLASSESSTWKITSIESSLSLRQDKSFNADIMQSFFIFNSLKRTSEGNTNLFGIVGSPYSEDIKTFYDKLDKYIHPGINQGKIIYESILGGDFNYDIYIREEVKRGFDFISYSIGTTRQVLWEEQQKYYCLAVIERINGKGTDITNLYTFDKESPLREELREYFPSYYLLSILPDYYEKLIANTLQIFDKDSIIPHIRLINLSNDKFQTIYLEEFLVGDRVKKSYGVVLIPQNPITFDINNKSFYRRTLRNLLDRNKRLDDVLYAINPDIINKSWSVKTEEDLQNIKDLLDGTKNKE